MIEFTVEGYVLKDALTRVKPAIPRRGSGVFPVLHTAQFDVGGEQVQVRATDVALTIETTVEASQVSGGGRWHTVDHAGLVATLKGLTKTKAKKNPTPVTVRIPGDGQPAEVRVGALTHSVPSMSSDELPLITPVTEGPRFEVPVDVWRMVLPYASTDDARPILTSVYFGDGEVAATDSYRLIAGPANVPDGVKILVPAVMGKTFLKSKEPIRLTVGERDVTARFEDMTVTARLIEGDFPNYRQLIPDSSPSSVTIAKADYDAFLGVLPKKSPAPFRIDRDDNKAVLSHTIPDGPTAEAIVEAEWDAPESVERKPGFPGGRTETVWSGTLAFNGAHFKDLIAEQGDLVKLEFTDALKPAVVSWMHEGALFNGLIMPVRVA